MASERRYTDFLVVHCSATGETMDIGVDQIRDWHVNGEGWADVGYHFVIRRDGKIEEGRHDEDVGAHARGYNQNSLGICLVGGVDANDKGKAEFNYSRAQMQSLEFLLNGLLLKYKKAEVVGHNELDRRKACPCFDVRAWWYGSKA